MAAGIQVAELSYFGFAQFDTFFRSTAAVGVRGCCVPNPTTHHTVHPPPFPQGRCGRGWTRSAPCWRSPPPPAPAATPHPCRWRVVLWSSPARPLHARLPGRTCMHRLSPETGSCQMGGGHWSSEHMSTWTDSPQIIHPQFIIWAPEVRGWGALFGVLSPGLTQKYPKVIFLAFFSVY